ncbi:MAG: biotin/lipoyl-binding protein [Oscillospiraceae bacterium]|nr:biotin/lipoyl-binding protein [Oscillospiraceae bacterium]
MKRYNITVNGTAYDVAVEEIAEGAAPVAAPAPAAPAAPKAAAPKPAAGGAQGGVKITAPMPGTIVEVKAKVGDTVKNGTVIAVLEAMKMENDIVADRDGTIASINVNKGDSVSTGAVIATLNA